MLMGRIEGASRPLGAPESWDQDGASGKCATLWVRDTQLAGGEPCMISAWFPTPEEIAAIQRGEPVYLYVIATGHPPVHLGVKGVAGAD